jgi:PAS domain S-box-containing protein
LRAQKTKIEQAAPGILLSRTVSVLLRSRYYLLTGDWSWDIYTNDVFCSDVILSVVPDISGLRAIIHPDDITKLEQAFRHELPFVTDIEFRIITTYGEIKTIAGCDIRIVPDERSVEDLQEILNTHLNEQKELEALRLQKAVYAAAEKITDSGIWYYNASTHETWYSDQVFRLHDLQPQTLNSHLYTFISFIHPEDLEQTKIFIEKAYKTKLPLHLEFRIVTSRGEKLVQYISNWTFNEKGEIVLTGIYKNITEEKALEQRLELAEEAAVFHKQVMHFDEHHVNLGHWQVNLMTRKLSFTDNFFRLFGFKSQALPSGIKAITNFLHPDDRENFLHSVKKMFNEHCPPDLNYRVLRPDGKIRHIQQKGKLVNLGNELVMTCTIQDITVKKTFEKKISDLIETVTVNQEARKQAEGLKSSGSWIWNMTTGETTWSEGLHNLLGLKPGPAEITQKRLLLLVHPDDKKRFTDELALVVQNKKEKTIEFRSVDRGELKYMKAGFKVVELEKHQYFIGQLFDITSQTTLQNTLYQRIQLAESLSENILDRVIITDISNNILLWNKQSEEHYNVKRDQAIGRNFFDVLPKLKTEEEVRLFDRVLKGEAIHLTDQRSIASKGFYDIHMIPVWSSEELEVTGIIHIIHDITKEYELRRSLNDRLNFIESLVDASVDRIIVLDRNMCYLAWNKKCEDKYGWKKEDVLGKNVLDLFPGWQDENAYTHFRKALTGETVHLPPDADSGRDYEVYLIPVKNEREEIFAVLWVMHDFELEFQLEYHKKKNLQVLNSLDENYVELDHEYRFVFLNKSAANYFNVDPAYVTGKIIWDVLPKSENTRIKEAVITAMEERLPVRGEFFAPTTNIHVFVSITPTDEGVSIIFIDIEEQKENQLLLQEREDLINQVTYATPDSITIYDLENKEPLYLNNRLAEWLGYTNHELRLMEHQGRLQLFHPDDQAQMMVFNEQMNGAPDDQILTIEYTLLSREGNPIRIRNRSKVFRRNAAGKAVKMLSVLQRLDHRS